MLDLPMVEPAPRESLTDAVVRLGGKRRLFIDMPSDPRLASCDVSELRACFGRSGVLTVLCTLPLSGQLARHAQVAQLLASAFDRPSVVQGQSVSVRVEVGGRLIIKKKRVKKI